MSGYIDGKTKGVHVTWHGSIVSPDGTEIALGQSNWFPNLGLETFEAIQRAEAAIARFVDAENISASVCRSKIA